MTIYNLIRQSGKNISSIKSFLCHLLLCLFIFPASLFAAQENGFIGRIGIGSSYLYHNAKTKINGVEASIHPSLGYIFRDYAKIETAISFGAAPTDYSGEYPVGLSTSLSDFTFNKGGEAISFGFMLKGGWNLMSIWQNWDHALYINGGTSGNAIFFVSTYAPVSPTLSFVSSFIELEGRKSLSERLNLEYISRVNIGVGSQIAAISSVAVQSSKELTSSANSYGFMLQLGFTYKIAKRAYFFSKLILSYDYMKQSKAMTITTQANTNVNGIKPNTTAIFQYPNSHTMTTSLQFGFGF